MLYKPSERGSTAKDGKVDKDDDDEGSDVEVQPTNGGGRRALSISHRKKKLPTLADSVSEQVFKNKIKLRKKIQPKEKKESSGGGGGEFWMKKKKDCS